MPRQLFISANCAAYHALVASVVTAMLGCLGERRADYSQLDLAEVTGTVTLDGTPLADATVVFEDATGRFSFGKTNEVGEYRLRYTSEQFGVTKGAKTVRISTRQNTSEDKTAVTDGPTVKKTAVRERIPARFNVRSRLRVIVQSNSERFNFDLTTESN